MRCTVRASLFIINVTTKYNRCVFAESKGIDIHAQRRHHGRRIKAWPVSSRWWFHAGHYDRDERPRVCGKFATDSSLFLIPIIFEKNIQTNITYAREKRVHNRGSVISVCRNAWTRYSKSPHEMASRSSSARKGTRRRKLSPTGRLKYPRPLIVCKESSPLFPCNCYLSISQFCVVVMSIAREIWQSRSQSSKIQLWLYHDRIIVHEYLLRFAMSFVSIATKFSQSIRERESWAEKE